MSAMKPFISSLKAQSSHHVSVCGTALPAAARPSLMGSEDLGTPLRWSGSLAHPGFFERTSGNQNQLQGGQCARWPNRNKTHAEGRTGIVALTALVQTVPLGGEHRRWDKKAVPGGRFRLCIRGVTEGPEEFDSEAINPDARLAFKPLENPGQVPFCSAFAFGSCRPCVCLKGPIRFVFPCAATDVGIGLVLAEIWGRDCLEQIHPIKQFHLGVNLVSIDRQCEKCFSCLLTRILSLLRCPPFSSCLCLKQVSTAALGSHRKPVSLGRVIQGVSTRCDQRI